MDELTLSHELSLFREFRSDAPGPSAAETEAARARLLDAVAAEGMSAARRASSRRWVWLRHLARTRVWAPVAAAAAVTAIAITVSLVAAPPGATPKPKPSPAATHPTPQRRHQKSGSSHPANGSAKASAAPGQASQAGRKSAGKGTAGVPGSATSPGPAIATKTSLVLSAPAVNPGQTVTLTATVTGPPSDSLPGGTVTFYLDVGQNDVYSGALEPLCSGTELSGQTAECSYTPESSQTDLISAGYSGNGLYQDSESGSEALMVWQSTDTTITLSSAQVSPGQTVTLTATLTDPAGDNLSGGTMGFYLDVGSNHTYSGALEPLCKAALSYNPATGENVATCTYTPQSAETDVMLAEYSGYGQYEESGSTADLTVS